MRLSGGKQVAGGFDRIAQTAPVIESARQRANMPHAGLSQLQRHTGAGGLTRSSTVQNDFLTGRNLMGPGAQIVGPQDQRAGDLESLTFDLGRMPQIDDRNRLRLLQKMDDLFRSNAIHTQLAPQSPALKQP